MFQKIMYLLTSLFYKIRRPIVQMDPASYSGLVSEMKKEFVTKGEFRQEMDRIDKKFDAIDQRFDTMEKKLDVRFDKIEGKIEAWHNDFLAVFEGYQDVFPKTKVLDQRVTRIEKHLGFEI